ncbi:MAG TPA: alpha/beta fold hydrolase [Verrucomicrobiae bacterium]|nr:alpha/beta fold hydrolase [Verrucomicrobiae bacterium]
MSDQPSKRNRRRLKNFGALVVAAAILGAIFVWSAGGVLVAPSNCSIGNPPTNLSVQPVEFSSASGATLHGWLVPGQPGKGVMILMHGVHANRLALITRAQFLSRAGYSVLMFDFQGHGESAGTNITFGYLESRDATAAVDFVRQKFPGEKIGVIGISLGAASALLAEPPLPVSALVLESSYPTIYQAVEDRLAIRFGFPGKLATPLLTCQLKPRLGISLDDLKPIEHARKISTPKFFIAGTADRDTTLPESQALFDAAAEPKQIWLVEGAAHVDMLSFSKAEYEKRILDFLAKNLN